MKNRRKDHRTKKALLSINRPPRGKKNLFQEKNFELPRRSGALLGVPFNIWLSKNAYHQLSSAFLRGNHRQTGKSEDQSLLRTPGRFRGEGLAPRGGRTGLLLEKLSLLRVPLKKLSPLEKILPFWPTPVSCEERSRRGDASQYQRLFLLPGLLTSPVFLPNNVRTKADQGTLTFLTTYRERREGP